VLVTTCVGYQGSVLGVLRSPQEFLVDRAGLKQLLMDPPGFIGRLTAYGILAAATIEYALTIFSAGLKPFLCDDARELLQIQAEHNIAISRGCCPPLSIAIWHHIGLWVLHSG
jgi:hypothetical protein